MRVFGEVDITCVKTLERLERELKQANKIVLDVGGLDYFDTTFLRFLLRVRSQENKESRDAMRLIGVKPMMRRVLEVTGLGRVFAYDRPHVALGCYP